jgi:DNA-binding GntR family transcriptional regulator
MHQMTAAAENVRTMTIKTSKDMEEGSLSQYLPSVPTHGAATDDVTHALREAILDGAIPPSTWLREQGLAAALGVSRTPIREALRRLEDERLVERVANRGSMVVPMTLDEVLAVYHVRETLEGLAARTAALQHSADVVRRLERIHHEMVEASRHSPGETLAGMNLAFHRVIRESSASNPYLARFLLQVEHAVRRFGRTTYERQDRTEKSLAEHEEIIRAISAGDPDWAERAASAHMRRARDARIDMMTADNEPLVSLSDPT